MGRSRSRSPRRRRSRSNERTDRGGVVVERRGRKEAKSRSRSPRDRRRDKRDKDSNRRARLEKTHLFLCSYVLIFVKLVLKNNLTVRYVLNKNKICFF